MTDDRRQAWAAVRRLPGEGLALLDGADDPWARWARGVLLQARGDFGQSLRLLRVTAASGGEIGALSSARIASGLRQLDAHRTAMPWDARATRTAVADGWIGLAADRVGVADASGAARVLTTVRPRDVRDDIRRSWVSCEIALLQGHGRAATRHAERALRLSLGWGPRHEIKSRLFLAATLRVREPERSVRLIRPALTEAVRGGLWPLVWPMVAVLGDRAEPSQEAAAVRAVAYIAPRLPTGVGATWLARPDITAWRAAASGPTTDTDRTSRTSAS